MMVGLGLAEVGVVRRKRTRGMAVAGFIVGEDEGRVPPGRVVVFESLVL